MCRNNMQLENFINYKKEKKTRILKIKYRLLSESQQKVKFRVCSRQLSETKKPRFRFKVFPISDKRIHVNLHRCNGETKPEEIDKISVTQVTILKIIHLYSLHTSWQV